MKDIPDFDASFSIFYHPGGVANIRCFRIPNNIQNVSFGTFNDEQRFYTPHDFSKLLENTQITRPGNFCFFAVNIVSGKKMPLNIKLDWPSPDTINIKEVLGRIPIIFDDTN